MFPYRHVSSHPTIHLLSLADVDVSMTVEAIRCAPFSF